MDADVEAAAIFNRPRTVDRRKVESEGFRETRWTSTSNKCPPVQSATWNNPNLTVVLFTFRTLKMSSKVQPYS